MLHMQKEDRRLAIFYFACGAYENIWQETIGIYFWHKLLILLEFPKNVFRGVPMSCEIFSKDSVRIANIFCIHLLSNAYCPYLIVW